MILLQKKLGKIRKIPLVSLENYAMIMSREPDLNRPPAENPGGGSRAAGGKEAKEVMKVLYQNIEALRVPRVALGCMRIGGLEAGQAEAVVKTALELVINFFDHADIYAGGLAGSVEKYDKIIFVGDSRTAMLRSTLKQQCSSDSLKKVGFVCKTGEGLDWMKKYGEKELLNEISGMDDNAKPVAVIFNLGVNDLIHKNRKSISYDSVASDYASYMNGLSRKLTARNCELFYMSVNPCNTAMKSTRKESEIRGFNNRLRQRLNGNFTWINSYSYLMRCGYTTRCEFRGYTDDGVHYSMRTYKRIYAYAIKQIR